MSHQGRSLTRRHILAGASTAAGAIGLRSAFGGIAEKEKSSRMLGPDVDDPEAIKAFLAKWFVLRKGVTNPFPGVYASHGVETVYLIECGPASVLVDTGFQQNFEGHLSNFRSAGLDLSKVKAILTSHFHVDHTSALADAHRLLNCPVIAHRNNLRVMGEGDLIATAAHMWAIPGWRFSYQPYNVDIPVEEGDSLEVGNTTFTVFHLPGHTPGCTGYLWNGRLITGDVIFPPGILGWDDVHWGSSYQDVIATMKKIASIQPSHLLPSHGKPFEWTSKVTDLGTRYAEHMLDNNRHGPMLLTQRARRCSADRRPERIQL